MEPDNLLAFIALLGLLRVLEESRLDWCPRVSWTVDTPPLRPALRVPKSMDESMVVKGAVEGLRRLASRHEFGGRSTLAFSPDDAARNLGNAASAGSNDRYVADLWASLLSDAAITRDGKKIEPTPLCLMFGQGHQYFLSRLASIPREKCPPERGRGRQKIAVSEDECLREAIFASWHRPDDTPSFRWDPHEDVRYALRARDPTDAKTKETTQHGANRLAAIGLSVLTVVPTHHMGTVKLAILGGYRGLGSKFEFRWPIWRAPVSLAGIRSLLGHPHLGRPDVRDALGVVEIRRARRISTGRYMNFTRAEPIPDTPPTPTEAHRPESVFS